MTQQETAAALERGQLLNDLKNSPGWPVLEEILNEMDAQVVSEWRSVSPLDTAKVMALHAKANAIREVHINLLALVNEAIEIAIDIMQNAQPQQF